MAKSNKHAQADEKTKIDELNDSLTNAGATLARNRRTAGWIVCGVLVVAAAVLGFIFWRNNTNTKSAEAYAKAEQIAYKATMKNASPTDSLFNANLLAEYDKIIKAEGSNVGGNLARIAAAQKYYDAGKYQKTIDYLKEAKISEPVLNAECQILTADCYVNLNKYADAIKSLDETVKDAKDYPMVCVRALLKKALVLDAQKNYNGALEVYKQIKKDYPREMEEYSSMSMQGGPETAFSIDAYIAREEARAGK